MFTRFTLKNMPDFYKNIGSGTRQGTNYQIKVTSSGDDEVDQNHLNASALIENDRNGEIETLPAVSPDVIYDKPLHLETNYSQLIARMRKNNDYLRDQCNWQTSILILPDICLSAYEDKRFYFHKSQNYIRMVNRHKYNKKFLDLIMENSTRYFRKKGLFDS